MEAIILAMGVQLGRYELVRPLARGGMAEVFLARRRGPGGVEKQLVVKRIAREKSRDPRFGELFVDEARLSMSLAHKNIVPVFDFGRAGDELFLVMEFVDGIDLSLALRRSRELDLPPSPALIAFLGIEAAQALDYAHTKVGDEGEAKGVVHRDVTPNNILVSTAGEVKLVDFGVASLTEDSLGDGKIRGTPSYMSPEQAHGQNVDPRSDIFSLGLILWEAAAGRRAYPGKSAKAVLEKAKNRELGELGEETPKALREIIERATALEPNDRFDSAGDLYRALDSFLVVARAEAGSEAKPPTTVLAEWVTELRPKGKKKLRLEDVAPVTGEVVTFLAEGPAKIVETIAGEGPGEATLRSMAATMVEEGEPDSHADADAEAEAPSPPSRKLLWVAGLGALGLAGLIAASLFSQKEVAPQWDAGVTVARADAQIAAITVTDATSADARIIDAAPSAVHDAKSQRPADAAAASSTKKRDAGSAATASPPGEAGTVRVSTSPWAKVTVVGRTEQCKETPCTLSLPPGKYQLRLENPVAKLGATIEVEVVAGETHTVRQSLTRAVP